VQLPAGGEEAGGVVGAVPDLDEPIVDELSMPVAWNSGAASLT
jgi:hypothetical protein